MIGRAWVQAGKENTGGGDDFVDHSGAELGAGLGGLVNENLDEDTRGRPFAGVVDEIADHLLEVLPLAAELCL